MNFDLNEDQIALRDLARRVLADSSAEGQLQAVDLAEDRFDPNLWRTLGTTGLIGISVPEEWGGAGGGAIAQAVMMVEAGRTLAAVPLLAGGSVAAPALANFGTPALREAMLPQLLAGTSVVTVAMSEPLQRRGSVATTATPDGNGWRLNGTKTMVPYAKLASSILVPAKLGGQIHVFVVDSQQPGVELERQQSLSGEPDGLLDLRDVFVDGSGRLLGGDATYETMLADARIAACALQLGRCESVLELTAAYVSTREQFGRPIATFQAVGHRMADAYIDLEAIRLTMWQAAYLCQAGAAPASRQAAIATAGFWAGEGGNRILHAAIHVHGGMGSSYEYPLHRYFLQGRQAHVTLGTTTDHLRDLGDRLVDVVLPQDSDAA